MKTVLYLIQAKVGLPDIYQCLRKRSWLLLSYRDKTSDTTIHAPNTTWAQGRNKLYQYVREQNLLYDYYVFLDEDLVFAKMDPTIAYSMKIPQMLGRQYHNFFTARHLHGLKRDLTDQAEGFTNFEAVLELGYPIVVPLDYGWLMGGQIVNLNVPLQTVGIFDGNFNAFSREVFFAETILPYTEQYDSTSWWVAQNYLCVKAHRYYSGQIIQNNQYLVLNTQHSDYTQNLNDVDVLTLRDQFINELGVPLPLNEGELIESSFAKPLPGNFFHKAHTYIKVFLMALGYRIYIYIEAAARRIKSPSG